MATDSSSSPLLADGEDEFSRKVRRKCLSDQLWGITTLAIFIVIYLMIGTVFYTYMEHWPFFYSFYFCVVTMGTVGYGSNDGIEGYGEPRTAGTRAFTIFYIAAGIYGVLSRISSLLNHIQQSTEASTFKPPRLCPPTARSASFTPVRILRQPLRHRTRPRTDTLASSRARCPFGVVFCIPQSSTLLLSSGRCVVMRS